MKENFVNMYKNIYKAMVTAGNETGLPSKFQHTKPKFLLFMDERVCNTNQLNNGKVGGLLFVVPKNDNEQAHL
jgi:hypothetical protein